MPAALPTSMNATDRNDFAAQHYGLVGSVALRIANSRRRRGWPERECDPADYFQAGVRGLLRAVERFDPSIASFSTHALPYIAEAIKRDTDKTPCGARLPVHVRKEFNHFQRTARGMGLSPDFDGPDADRVSSEAFPEPKTRKRVRSALMLMAIKRLDVSGPTPPRFMSHFEAAAGVRASDARDTVERLMRRCLTPKQRTAVRLRYGLDGGAERTLDEVGALMGFSRGERVRQLLNEAMAKMQAAARDSEAA